VFRFPIKNRKILAVSSHLYFMILVLALQAARSQLIDPTLVFLYKLTLLYVNYYYYYYYYYCPNLFFLEDVITLIQIVYTFISWDIISNLRIYNQYFLTGPRVA
jgi:hypothetical protein